MNNNMKRVIDTTARIMGHVEYGKNVFIGPYSVIGHPYLDERDNEVLLENNEILTATKPVYIGDNTVILSHVVIGEDSTLCKNVWCDHFTYVGSMTYVADDVQIIYGAKIYHRVKIGEKCWIGGFVCNDAVIEPKSIVLGSLVHRFVEAVEGIPEKSPIIREGAFIGMNSMIIGGIEVGKGAYIAAGAILTKSALPGRLYCGSPAKDIGPAPAAFKVNGKGI